MDEIVQQQLFLVLIVGAYDLLILMQRDHLCALRRVFLLALDTVIARVEESDGNA